jgi:predicted regulator of Ras-like GTPase activity (Roadblock/LC7/MglB family)
MSSGKRYSIEEKEAIMFYRQTHTYQETAAKYEVSQMTLARWSRQYKRKAITGDRYIGDPDYKTYLYVLKYLEGVKAVALFSDMTEGSAVAGIIDENVSEDALFIEMTTILGVADRSSEELDLGKLEMVVTKNSEGILLIRGVGPTLALILIYRGMPDLQKIILQDGPMVDRVCQDIIHRSEKKE